jgi:hypothetical protein
MPPKTNIEKQRKPLPVQSLEEARIIYRWSSPMSVVFRLNTALA